MGADTHHCPVGTCRGIGEGGLFAENGHQEVVYQVWVAAAVACALKEAEVGGIVDGSRELADAFG